MNVNITYQDFNIICRLCLTKIDSSRSVFQENIEQLLDKMGVPISLNKLEDELPQGMCKQCDERIENIFTFISQCMASYRILSAILLSEKTMMPRNKIYNNSSLGNSIDFLNHKQGIEIKSNQDDKKHIIIDNDVSEISQDHLSVSNTTKLKIVCKKCNLLFKSKVSLSTHYKRQKQCRPDSFRLFKCEYCLKEFLSLRDKVDHENVHTGTTPYACPYCIKKFKFKTNLYRHIYRHKRKLGLVERNASYIEKRVRLKLKCDICDKIFSSRSGFQHHKLKHEGKVLPRKNSVKLDKSFKHFLCNYCAMGFYIKANLDAHLRVHTGERPYKCNHCDKQFKQKSVLNRHILSHLDVRPKPFMCDICQKNFTTKAHMEIHKRLHTGEKPYECSFCQKCFNYKTRWRIHLRLHTGESPFLCSICNNSYHDKGSLKKHQKKKGHIVKEVSKN